MNFISLVFLIVSVISLVVQLAGLARMIPEPSVGEPTIVQKLVRQGMVRTAACRTLAAVFYVVLSSFLIYYDDTFPLLSLSVFIAIQLMWQGNALADAILRRKLEAAGGKHRQSGSLMNLSFLKGYAKSWTQLLGAVLVAVMPLLSTNGPLTTSEWVNVATVGVGAGVVWNTTNHPEWPYAKLVGSALVTALTTLNSFLSDGLSNAEIMQMVLALAVTMLVGVVPNTPKEIAIPISNMNPEHQTGT